MIVCSMPGCQTTAGCKCQPISGYVIAPARQWEHEAASIICGHPFIQGRLFFAEQDKFETFVREVLRTTRK